MLNETEEKERVVNSGELHDVYDHVERLQREIKQLTAERDEFKGQAELHQFLYTRVSDSRDYWKKTWREQYDRISTLRTENVRLKYDNRHLLTYASELKSRSLLERIRNTDPTF